MESLALKKEWCPRENLELEMLTVDIVIPLIKKFPKPPGPWSWNKLKLGLQSTVREHQMIPKSYRQKPCNSLIRRNYQKEVYEEQGPVL